MPQKVKSYVVFASAVVAVANGLLGGWHAIGRYAQYQRLPPNDKVQRTAHQAPSAGTNC
jgi:hypothetical protein